MVKLDASACKPHKLVNLAELLLIHVMTKSRTTRVAVLKMATMREMDRIQLRLPHTKLTSKTIMTAGHDASSLSLR